MEETEEEKRLREYNEYIKSLPEGDPRKESGIDTPLVPEEKTEIEDFSNDEELMNAYNNGELSSESTERMNLLTKNAEDAKVDSKDLMLSEEDRVKLDGIVIQMESNNESSDDINFLVNDFKQKYGKKKISDTGGSTSGSEDGASDSSVFDYNLQTQVWLKDGYVVDASQVPDFEKERVYSEQQPIKESEDDISAQVNLGKDAIVHSYPVGLGDDGEYLSTIRFGEDDSIVYVDSEGQKLNKTYNTLKEELDSLKSRYNRMSEAPQLPGKVSEEILKQLSEKQSEFDLVDQQIKQNIDKNKTIQLNNSLNSFRGNEKDWDAKIIYSLPSEHFYNEDATEIFGRGLTTQELLNYQGELLSDRANNNYGIVGNTISEFGFSEYSKEDLTNNIIFNFESDLEDNAKKYLTDEDIQKAKLSNRAYEIEKELENNPRAENANELRKELRQIKRGIGSINITTPMFNVDGERIDREFANKENVQSFNQQVELNYQMFDQTDRGELMTVYERYSSIKKQLENDFETLTFKDLLGQPISIKDAFEKKNIDRMGVLGGTIDDAIGYLGLEPESEKNIRRVVGNYKRLYEENESKLIAATRVLATNTDPGSIDKGGFANLKLFAEGFGEGFLDIFVDNPDIKTDADFIATFGQIMQENGIEMTEDQIKQTTTDISDMVASGLGTSLPIMAQIMLTRKIPLSLIGKLRQTSRYKALTAYANSYGTTGKFALKLSEDILTGATSFGLVPSDNISVAMGVGEGTVGAVFETFFPQSKAYHIIRRAFESAGAKGINIGAYSIRILGGGAGETIAEYSGDMLNNLTKNGFDWENALEQTFGRTGDEALDKLVATALTCTMFSSAFNAGMLNLTIDEINQKYGDPNQDKKIKEALAKLNLLIEKHKQSEPGTQLSLLDNEAFVEGTVLVDDESIKQRGGEAILVPEGSKLFNDPVKETALIADEYLQNNSEGLGVTPTGARPIPEIDIENSKRIADAFDAMKHEPTNPEVVAAYEAMAKETIDQFNLVSNKGYKVEIWKGEGEPYANSAEMIKDVRDNKHMYIYSTESGFGQEGITKEQREENPLLSETEFTDINGEPLVVNDLFRFVHDFFGHTELGNGFGPKGEENAWVNHSRMYSPEARRAMTTETRGQNSWVNFGKQIRREDGSIPKKGDPDYVPLSEREYADQKIGLLPDDIVNQLPNMQTVITEDVDIEPTIEFSEESNTFVSEQIENALSNKVDGKNNNKLGRLDLGMSTVNIQKGISDYVNNLESDERAQLEDALRTMYDSGEIKFLGVDGKKVVRTSVSVSDSQNLKEDIKVTKDTPYVFNKPELNKEQFELNMERTQNGTVEGGTTFNEEIGNLDGKKLFSVSIFPEMSLVKESGETFTQQEIEAFKVKHKDILDRSKNLAVGTFTSGLSGKSYLDIVALVPSSNAVQAEQLAIAYNQESFYDLEKGKVIEVGGTGETVEGLPDITERLSEIETANVTESYVNKLDNKIQEYIENIDLLSPADPFLVTATVRAGLVVMQKALRAGVTVANAMQQAIDYIKTNKPSDEIFDEDSFKAQFTDSPNNSKTSANINNPNRNSDGIIEVNETELESEPVEVINNEAKPETVQTNRPGDASRMDGADKKRKSDYEKSRKRFTIEEFRIKLNELGFDENYRIKRELLKLAEENNLTEEALNAIANRELQNGASAAAKNYSEEVTRKMDGGVGKSHLNKSERDLSDRLIEAERIISLDKHYDKMKLQVDELINDLSTMEVETDSYNETLDKINILSDKMGLTFDSENGNLMMGEETVPEGLDTETFPWRLKHPVGQDGEMISGEDAQSFIDREMSNNPDYERAKERADVYFDATSNLLKFKLEEGLIDKETYDRLSEMKYSPRAFIEHMMSVEDAGKTDRTVEQLSSPLKSLDGGSGKSLHNDATDLIQKQISGTYKLAFKNRARKGLLEVINQSVKDGKDISDFGYVIDRKNPLMDGYVSMDVMVDGKKISMAIDQEMAQSFDGGTQNLPGWLRWVSGSQILKTFATGINPLFAIGNLPRDFVHVIMSTDTYGTTLPVSAAKLSYDILSNASTSVSRGEDYQKAISQGMGMDFLSTQGKVNINKGDSRTQKTSKNVFNALSWFGETSEIMVRMAVRSRQISNRTKEFESVNGRKPNAKELEKIERLATNDSRQTMDFGKGGRWAKQADTVLPYLNASLQGFKVSAKYIKDNPGKSAVKITQLGASAMALTAYNITRYREDYDKISQYEKINNFIFMLPTKDEDGNRQYMRIRKDHFMIPFTTFFDDLAYQQMTGLNPNEGKHFSLFLEDEDKSNIAKAWEMSTPLSGFNPIEALTGVPIVNAGYSYISNYDTFRDKEIYPGAEEIPDFLEYYKGTPKTFVKIGRALDLSPERLKTSVGKLVTDPRNNVYYQAFDGIYEEMTEGMDESQIVEFDRTISKGWEKQLGESSFRTVVRTVPEFAQDESISIMKKAKQEENGKKKVLSRTKYFMADEFAKADEGKRVDILNNLFDIYNSQVNLELGYEVELSESDKESLINIMTEATLEKEFNVSPQIARVANSMGRNPEAAAVTFHYLQTKIAKKFGDPSPEMSKFMEEASSVEILKPGDTKFNRYLLKLKSEQKKIEE